MYKPEIGQPVAALDTPAVLVDLDLMQQNIARLFERLQPYGVNVRPHLKTVKSPVLARMLIDAGAVGGCIAKLGEAEVMAEGGINDLLLTTELVGAAKLSRLVDLLQRHPELKLRVVVDSREGAIVLNNALATIGRELETLIDLNVGQNRTGITPGEPALELARQLEELPMLKLIGVQGYEGHLQHIADAAEKEQRCRASMQLLTDTANLLRQNGFDIRVVTTGGTGTAEICAAFGGITEVQPGSFIFMDTAYRGAIGPRYDHALSIVSTVLSRPAPERAVIDAGLKSLSTDSGNAGLKDVPGVSYRPGGDEHGILEGQNLDLQVGDRVELFPSHIDTTINLHDYYFGHRGGKLEAIWPIAARGKVQ